jgi:ssDNA-binding Zn-finger/Zn-ribbon topoisomerase 1
MSGGKCDRCGSTGQVLTMSRFNTEWVCCGPGSCEEIEKAHPLYPAARAAEEEAVRRGDMNFPGVGKPPDLRGKNEQSPPAA